MRVVGLLLISALMIVPVATAQLVARSFRATTGLAMVIGIAVAVAGVSTSFYTDTPSGGTIVLFAIGVFIVVAIGTALRTKRPGASAAEIDQPGITAVPGIPTGSHF
jgi:zinc transport system permease protein